MSDVIIAYSTTGTPFTVGDFVIVFLGIFGFLCFLLSLFSDF